VEKHGYAAWPEVFEMTKSKSKVRGGVRVDGGSTSISLTATGCWNPDMQWKRGRERGGAMKCVVGDANAGMRYANASSSIHD
jgi:hypothetical protein